MRMATDICKFLIQISFTFFESIQLMFNMPTQFIDDNFWDHKSYARIFFISNDGCYMHFLEEWIMIHGISVRYD